MDLVVVIDPKGQDETIPQPESEFVGIAFLAAERFRLIHPRIGRIPACADVRQRAKQPAGQFLRQLPSLLDPLNRGAPDLRPANMTQFVCHIP